MLMTVNIECPMPLPPFLSFPRNVRTLVESEITESTKQKSVGEKFKLWNFSWYAWHFQSQVPPAERLTDVECRLAWARDWSDPTVEKCTRKVLNRKTGKFEEQDMMYVDVGGVARKEQIASEKKQASVVHTRANPDDKAVQQAKSSAIAFLTMAPEDDFFAATRKNTLDCTVTCAVLCCAAAT